MCFVVCVITFGHYCFSRELFCYCCLFYQYLEELITFTGMERGLREIMVLVVGSQIFFIYRLWLNKKENKFISIVRVNEFNTLFSAFWESYTESIFLET